MLPCAEDTVFFILTQCPPVVHTTPLVGLLQIFAPLSFSNVKRWLYGGMKLAYNIVVHTTSGAGGWRGVCPPSTIRGHYSWNHLKWTFLVLWLIPPCHHAG